MRSNRKAARPALLILDGALAGRRVSFDGELVVGRGEEADLLLDDGEISRRHALFRRSGDALEVEDAGSLNGTWVNGARIATSTHLVTGDVVKIGGTRVQILEAVRPAHASAAELPSREDELRPITALFADIAGSTSIGERFEPDEVKTLVGECVTRMSRIVERYGGAVDAYMGDGISAYFGLPVAHEDDVERAARAALEIIEAVGRYAEEVQATWSLPGFGVRVGVNSGQVAVGLVGAAAPRPVALGDTMNVAARLQSAAEPGTILVGGRSAQALRRRFVLEPLGPIAVKGRETPVDTWRLVRAQPGTEPTEVPPLVGREPECDHLDTALDALVGGSGQIVLLEGEPGLGKTRLLEWLRDRSGDRANWLEGTCKSFGAELPYAPFAEVLHGWLAVDSGSGDALAHGLLEARLGQLLGPRLPDVLPWLASLLSVRIDPEADAKIAELTAGELEREIRSAYCTWARALAETRPLVIALEDIHHADAPTLELAARLLDVVEAAPLALAVTFRPGPTANVRRFRETVLRDHAQRAHEVRLSPLDEADAARLLAERSPGLDEEVERDVIARADGNPLFLEQLLQFVLESGASARRRTWSMTVIRHEIPQGLEGLLMARIDALPAKARRLVQIAAVLEPDFSVHLLAAAAGFDDAESTIGALLRADVLHELRPPPDAAYEFTNELVREAALSTLPRPRRREIYRTVAATIERLYASSLDEHLQQLAFYNARAGDLPRALWYLERAAAQANTVHASIQAVELWKRAASIAGKIGDVDAQRRIGAELSRLAER